MISYVDIIDWLKKESDEFDNSRNIPYFMPE